MVTGYLRYPHVHGDLVTFVAGDDVWLAPAAGGRAWRLSADGTPVSYPRFSRDGTAVAWTGWRDGQPEVYTADPEGGDAARLTFWGDPQTRVTGWTAAGEVLAVTSAGQQATKYRKAFAIPGRGDAPPRPLPYGLVNDLAIEDAGTALLTGSVGGEPAFWKRYRGGRAGKLWVATGDDPLFTRVLADLGGQLASPMLIGGRLFFLSDHEGTGNIYSCALDGTGLARHTDHDGAYARNPSTDGHRIVYHVAGDLWMLDGPDAGTPYRIDITLGAPAAARAPRLISAADHLGDLDCDRTGQASVVEVRGTVHWLTHKDGPARALHVDPDARARLPRVLGETGKVVWVTDAAGPDALEIASVTGDAQTARLAEGALGFVLRLLPSPDGTTVAVAAHDGRLLLVDIASRQVTELAASDDGAIDGLSWSPDSAWLAWSQPGPPPLRRLRMARVADHEIVEVTDGRFADTDPVFTADGLYLAFLSVRSFDPVYDAQSFDMSFPFGSRPYLVPLAEDTPSPFGPLPEGRPVGAEARDENGDPAEPAAVTVDAAGLPDRVVPVPVIEARYSGLRAVKGGLLWRRAQVTGVLGEGGADLDDDLPRPALERFDLRKREVTEIAREIDWFDVSGDGTRLVVHDDGELRVMPASGKRDEGAETVTVDKSRARFQADPAALWRHAYAEAGRVMRRDFWVPDMSGVDWDGVGGGVPAAAGPDPQLGRLRRPALGTARRDRYVALVRAAGPGPGAEAPAGRAAGRGPDPGRGRALAGRPGAARRVVRPAGPLAAGRPRRGRPSGRRAGGRGRAAGRPGARPVAAAGRDRRPAGGAHGPCPRRASPAASWSCRCAASAGCATRTGWPGGAPWSASSARAAWATCTSPT